MKLTIFLTYNILFSEVPFFLLFTPYRDIGVYTELLKIYGHFSEKPDITPTLYIFLIERSFCHGNNLQICAFIFKIYTVP